MPRATLRYAIWSMTHGAESLLRGRQNELPQYSRTGEQVRKRERPVHSLGCSLQT